MTTFVQGRRGVTLIEVLIAIMVMSVGLLGLASLIPVGRYEVMEGRRVDQASTLGRSAFRDILVRGYLRPENWVKATVDPADKNVLRVQDSIQPPRAQFFTQPGQNRVPTTGPFVIDPLMVFPDGFGWRQGANNLQGGDESALAQHLERVKTFPYMTPGGDSSWPESKVPRIDRITLRQFPGQPWLMHHDLAERIFRSGDDLVKGERDRYGRRPELVFHRDTALRTNLPAIDTPTLITRHGVEREQMIGPTFVQYEGAYSWMITVSPTLYELYSPDELEAFRYGETPPPPAADASTARQYLVSVVVFYRRDLFRTDRPELDLSKRDRPERMAWVDFMGGPSARLRVAGIKNAAEAEKALNVRGNQWIAVVGQVDHPLLQLQWLPPGKVTVLNWYRIVSVGNSVYEVPPKSGSGVWYRDVTMEGRAYAMDDADKFSSYVGSSFEPPTGFGIILDGAIGVYEKTMTIDGSSLWSTLEAPRRTQ